MPTHDEGIRYIEGAFKPLKCGVEFDGHPVQTHFRFMVYDQDGKDVHGPIRSRYDFMRDDYFLREILTNARKAVEAKEHALYPWKYPGSP